MVHPRSIKNHIESAAVHAAHSAHQSLKTKKFRMQIVHSYVPKAVTAFVLAAHFSELQHAIEKTTYTNIFVTLAVFTAWVSVGSNTKAQKEV